MGAICETVARANPPARRKGTNTKVLFLFLVILFVASAAWAQGGRIGLFADATSLNCNLVDAAPGLLPIFCVHVNIACATAIQFSAVMPNCMTGAAWLSDTPVFSVTVGNSQLGVAIGYAAPFAGPLHVLTINIFAQGTSACCEWMPEADPNLPSGQIEVVDCGGNVVSAVGLPSVVNADGITCCCDCGPAEPSTWGRVKSLYGGSQ